MQMELGMFCMEMQEAIAHFNLYWQEQHRKNPHHFPLELEPGEWDEQFRVWQDGDGGEE